MKVFNTIFTEAELWKIREDEKRIHEENVRVLERIEEEKSAVRQAMVNVWLDGKLNEIRLRDALKARGKEPEKALLKANSLHQKHRENTTEK
jgi:hypothetical protein